MNIVDVIVIIHKYDNKKNKRHININNNISHYLRLNIKYINIKTHNIVNKYKRFLNQRDMNTLITCINNNIQIIPVINIINKNIMQIIFNKSNTSYLKIINSFSIVDDNIYYY